MGFVSSSILVKLADFEPKSAIVSIGIKVAADTNNCPIRTAVGVCEIHIQPRIPIIHIIGPKAVLHSCFLNSGTFEFKPAVLSKVIVITFNERDRLVRWTLVGKLSLPVVHKASCRRIIQATIRRCTPFEDPSPILSVTKLMRASREKRGGSAVVSC